MHADDGRRRSVAVGWVETLDKIRFFVWKIGDTVDKFPIRVIGLNAHLRVDLEEPLENCF